MAWMQCRSCSAKFAVGLLRCPQCTAVSELFAVPEEVIEAEQEAAMPKITVGGGASNALGVVEEPPAEVAVEDVASEAGPDVAVVGPMADDAQVADATPADVGASVADVVPAAKKRAAKKAVAQPETVPEG